MTGVGHEVDVCLSQQSGRKAVHEVGESKDKPDPETINWSP